MPMGQRLREAPAQAWRLRGVVIGVWIPAVIAVGIVLLARLRWHIPVLDLTGDPVVLMDAPLYLGAFSYLGVLVWCATAAVSLVLAQTLGNEAAETRAYLRGAGGLSVLLCLDDLYMFHEEVFPKHVGIPQIVVIGVYGLYMVGLLWRFRRVLLNGEFVLLALSLGMFAVSVAIDQLVTGERRYYLAEDGAKFFGVVMWLAFHTRLGLQALRRQVACAPR